MLTFWGLYRAFHFQTVFVTNSLLLLSESFQATPTITDLSENELFRTSHQGTLAYKKKLIIIFFPSQFSKPEVQFIPNNKPITCIGVSTPFKKTTPSFSPSSPLNLQTVQAPPFLRQFRTIYWFFVTPPKNRIF